MLANQQTQKNIVDDAQKSTVFADNPCAAAKFTVTPGAAIIKPMRFSAAGQMIDGAWKETVVESGCGSTRTLNVLAFVRQPGTLVTTPLLPGTTRADPLLQRDAVHYAVLAIGGPEKNCTVGYVADTEFVRFDGPPVSGGKGPPWEETWTLVSCSKEARVPVRFVPDAQGTAITAHVIDSKSHAKQP